MINSFDPTIAVKVMRGITNVVDTICNEVEQTFNIDKKENPLDMSLKTDQIVSELMRELSSRIMIDSDIQKSVIIRWKEIVRNILDI